jgi:hypothetical protein
MSTPKSRINEKKAAMKVPRNISPRNSLRLFAWALIGTALDFLLYGCFFEAGPKENNDEKSTPPVFSLTRVGDSLELNSDSAFKWISDFKFIRDTFYIVANQANEITPFSGRGGVFIYSDKEKQYVKKWKIAPLDRYQHIESIGAKTYLLNLNSICELSPVNDSCKSFISSPDMQGYRELWMNGGLFYTIVNSRDHVFDSNLKLMRQSGPGPEFSKVEDMFIAYDTTQTRFYLLNPATPFFGFEWNRFGGQSYDSEFRIPIPLTTPAQFNIIDSNLFVLGYSGGDLKLIFRNLADTAWKNIDIGISDKYPGITYSNDDSFLTNDWTEPDFEDCGKYIIYFDSRILRVIRKSDLSTRTVLVSSKVVGSKWLLSGNRVYTNGFKSLFYLEVGSLDSLFLSPKI